MKFLYDQARSIYRRVNDMSGGVLAILRRAFRRFGENHGPEAAASIAYYAFFSLFPLILFLVAVVSNVLEQEELQQRILEYAINVIPISQEFILNQIEIVLAARGTVSFLALIGFLWAASGVFNTFALNMDRAWQKVHSRNAFQRRLIALGMVGGLVGLTLISLVASTVYDLLPLERIHFGEFDALLKTPLTRVVSGTVPFIFRLVVVWVLYRLIPATYVGRLSAFWGALAATLAWELSTDIFTWWLSSGFVHYELIYGSLAAIIALLLWIYVTGWILLFGAHLTEAIEHHHIQKGRKSNVTAAQAVGGNGTS